MTRIIISILAITLAIIFANCTNTNSSVSKDKINFGENIDEQGAISYSEFITKISHADSLQTKLVGTVESVCQAKGCWMNVRSDSDTTLQPVFVEFQDYSFFVPKDIAGKNVVIKGRAYYEETSVEELKHYAEDEGKSEAEIDAINQPVRELKIMATGVKILK